MPDVRFSDRLGITKPRLLLQVREMDTALANSLWNLIDKTFNTNGVRWRSLAWFLAESYYRLPLDRVPHSQPALARGWFRERYFEAEWWERYNLIELIVQQIETITDGIGQVKEASMAQEFNVCLERELAAYRIINGHVVEVSGDADVQAVERALMDARHAGFGGVYTHLDEALNKLADKPEPDYRNAIKEAISAVESAAKVISGKEKATLDDALSAVMKASPIHGAMVEAFRKLYGFASDEKGIRHALLEGAAKVDAEDARFFVVACSAFVSLLIVKADKAGVLKK